MSNPVQPVRRSNGLGVAGFIVALIGLFTGGCLSVLGLLFSFFALFRAPRGLAFAGFILGLLGTAVWGAVFAFFGTIIWGAWTMGMPYVNSLTPVHEAEQKVRAYQAGHMGELPTDVEGNVLIAGEKDGWGSPLRYHKIQAGFEIRLAGPDRTFDTADDIKFEVN